MIKVWVYVLMTLVVIGLGFTLWARMAATGEHLGVREGSLAPCSETPNCVSTSAQLPDQRMAPMRYASTLEEAQNKLRLIVRAMPRTRVIKDEPGYMWIEFHTWGIEFVDDVEFYFDIAEPIIHFRSASRLGFSDFGSNRRRMESIRDAFQSTEPVAPNASM